MLTRDVDIQRYGVLIVLFTENGQGARCVSAWHMEIKNHFHRTEAMDRPKSYKATSRDSEQTVE